MLDLCQRNWRYRNATTDQIDNVFIEISSESNDRNWPTAAVLLITAYVCFRCKADVGRYPGQILIFPTLHIIKQVFRLQHLDKHKLSISLLAFVVLTYCFLIDY